MKNMVLIIEFIRIPGTINLTPETEDHSCFCPCILNYLFHAKNEYPPVAGRNGRKTARPQDRKTARLQDRKTARLQDRKTARPQDLPTIIHANG